MESTAVESAPALLYSGLGFWWCFHLFWTAWIIPKDQPDLAGNGTFFSLILVYFANLLLFLGLLRLFNAVSINRFLATIRGFVTQES